VIGRVLVGSVCEGGVGGLIPTGRVARDFCVKNTATCDLIETDGVWVRPCLTKILFAISKTSLTVVLTEPSLQIYFH
jgi:hypothetical protein